MKKAYVTISIFVILAVTFLSFYPSLKNEFTNWDDQENLIENQKIKSLSRQNIIAIFTSFAVGNYIPLTTLSYALEYRLFKLDPVYYHATNLILHMFNAILVFWFIYQLTGNLFVPFIVSLSFGIHPLHVESVAWISERKDVLYAFFFMGSLISYTYYLKKHPSRFYYYLSLVLFMISLLSKSMAISLPLILLLIDYFSVRRFDRQVLSEKIPFFLLAAISGIVTLYAQQSIVKSNIIYAFPGNLFIPFYGLLFYLAKMFVPVSLSAMYPYPDKISVSPPLSFIISPAFVLLIFLFIVAFCRKIKNRQYTVFGCLFFLLTILPVIQILPVGEVVVADRYTYVPLIGMFFIIGKGFDYVYNQKLTYQYVLKTLLLITFTFAAISLSFLTWQRCSVWKDSISLWSDVLEKYPKATTAYNNRGSAYFAKEDYDKAVEDFTVSLSIRPNDPGPYNNLCRTLLKKGLYKDAFFTCQKAIELKPDYVEAINNLGNVYISTGDPDNALKMYAWALMLNPDYAVAYNNMCEVYRINKEYEKGIAACEKAISLTSDYAEAYNNLGKIYFVTGKCDNAIELYKRAIKINPNYGAAYNDIAVAYLYLNQADIAREHIKKAMALGYKPHPEFLEKLHLHKK